MAPLPPAGSSPLPTYALSPLTIAAFGLLPFGLGYFLSYLFRAANAVVAPDLVAELMLDAGSLGFLTAAYLLMFSLFQLPLGVLLDRYGPRRVQAGLLLIAAVGAALFALGRDVVTLTIARGLIGLGFAGGLMASFKAVVVFVPEPRRALASSTVMSLGALGLLVSTSPLAALVQVYGWRGVFLGLAVITLAVGALIYAVVPRPDPIGQPAPLTSQIKTIFDIMRDRAFLRLAPMLGVSAGTHIAIQTLWAAPWLRDIAGLDRTLAAQHLFWMAFAFFAGILTTGIVADWLVRRGFNILDVLLTYLLCFFAAQALIVFNIAALPSWLLFGMLGQVAILAFPWLSSYFGAALSGRANAAMNLMVFGSAFLCQWGIGAIIDLFPRTAGGGYPLAAYQAGFGLFLALQIAGLLWYLPARSRLIAGVRH
jgi:predicted MFS family arabinose efflux permease